MVPWIKWIVILLGACLAVIALYALTGFLGFGPGLGGIFFIHLLLRNFDLAGTRSAQYGRLEQRMEARRERVRRHRVKSASEPAATKSGANT